MVKYWEMGTEFPSWRVSQKPESRLEVGSAHCSGSLQASSLDPEAEQHQAREPDPAGHHVPYGSQSLHELCWLPQDRHGLPRGQVIASAWVEKEEFPWPLFWVFRGLGLPEGRQDI